MCGSPPILAPLYAISQKMDASPGSSRTVGRQASADTDENVMANLARAAQARET